MPSTLFADIRVGLGTMSLCITADRPSEREAIRMIEDLIEQGGLTFIDTANVYCLNDTELGYGEDIVKPFVHRDGVLVATKGGMTRTGTAWGVRGDPAFLRSECEASLERLGVSSIELYQFHAPDENVPYAESLGELIRLREEGKIKNIGVSNVSLEELSMAKEMANAISVQNPLSVLFYDPKEHDPILRYCESNGIAFIAYAPLGGFRNPYVFPTVSEELNQIAERLGMTVYQLGLLTLCALSPSIIPIPGSKSKEHILENLAIAKLSLSKEDLARIAPILEIPVGTF
ncbi:MAG TPA: aldo/keto reductase [Candidatus Kapabacteria bacterium]|nr:aldo/keto reductase [Candidatus Kapabacteria bacterium]